MTQCHIMAESLFGVSGAEIAAYLTILKEQEDFIADIIVLLRNVAEAVVSTEFSLRTSILLPAVRELLGYPGGQTVLFIHTPPLAPSLDIVLVPVGKQLLLDFDNEFLQSIHASRRPPIQSLSQLKVMPIRIRE